MTAARCQTCPVLDVCRAAGDLEEWGVWAGICRSKTHQRRKENAA